MVEDKINILKYLKLFNEEVRILYNGPIESKLLVSMGAYVRAILSHNPKVGRKLLAIYIELSQNIGYYSAERCKMSEDKNIGSGILSISEYDDHYLFTTGNKIQNKDIFSLFDKCEYINSLDRESLREFKRDQRKLPFGVAGHAHIGLIQVALASNNPLVFEITPAKEDFSYFSISVKINKN